MDRRDLSLNQNQVVTISTKKESTVLDLSRKTAPTKFVFGETILVAGIKAAIKPLIADYI